VSLEARQSLVQYHWPGNVRELRNTLERAAILAGGGLIVSEHLALSPRPEPKAQAVTASAQNSQAHAPSDLSSVECSMIKQALEETRFNKSIAAKRLGLTRAQLYTRLKRYGLD
jgi:DNA-binding NtrC family response regulator